MRFYCSAAFALRMLALCFEAGFLAGALLLP